MPLYTYRRQDGTTFEHRQGFNDEPLTTCPTTGQSVKRLVQSAGVIFKGSGFYVTDSKGKNSAAPSNKPATTTDTTDSKPATSEASPVPAASASTND